MVFDQLRPPLDGLECGPEGGVALKGGRVEPVVCCSSASDFPDWLDGVELRRVRGQAVKLDLAFVSRQPVFAVVVEPVTRAVVDDEEDLARSEACHQLLKELPKRVAVEHFRETVGKRAVFERNGGEDMRGLALTESVDAWLRAYAGPRLVERAVEPEARFVFEEDEASACGGFFLIAGKRSFSQ